MPELQVVATIPAKPEHADAIREALTTLVAATREEEGCLAYDLFESSSAPGTFVTVERWTDQAALDAYLAYIDRELAENVPLYAMARHALGLFQGQPGARAWRRHISENGPRRNAGSDVLRDAAAHIREAV